MTEPISGGRAARDIAAQLVLRVLNLALGVAVTLITVRALGDEGFGQWATVLAVVTMAGYVGSLGLDRVAVERASAEPRREAEWLGSLVTLRLALAVPGTLAAALVILLVSDAGDMRTAGFLACTTLVSTAIASMAVVFQLRVRNRVMVALELLNGVVWAGIVVAISLSDAGIVELAIGHAVLTTVTNAVMIALTLRNARVRARGNRREWGDLLRRGLPVGIGGLLVIGYGYIDQILVFEIAGSRDAGLYGAAYRVLERIQFVPATLVATLFPLLVAARDADPARARRIFQVALDYLMVAALPALALTLAGPRPLASALFGAEFADAAPAFPILMGSFVVISVGYLCGYAVLTFGLQRAFLRYAAIALVFNVVGNLLLLEEYGFVAAAWMTLATEVLVTALTLRVVLPEIGVPSLHRVGRIAASAALLLGVAVALREAGAPLLAWVVAGIIVYAGALFALRALSVGEIRALLRRETL